MKRNINTNSDDNITQKRLDIIIEYVLAGLPTRTIKANCRMYDNKNPFEKLWDLSDRQIENYIRKANDYFAKESNIKRDLQLGKAIARYNSLYSNSYKLQDYRTCANINEKLCNLLGLNKLLIEVSKGENEFDIPKTPKQLAAYKTFIKAMNEND